MSRKKKDKSAQSTRQLMGIDSVKDYCIATRMGDLVFFIIKPTNISVLPDSSISARIYALLNVVKGQAEIEMLALNSKESFERNKTFYQERQTCEELPAIRRLLEQDSTHLDRIQVLMASSREFYIIIRLRKEKDTDVFPYHAGYSRPCRLARRTHRRLHRKRRGHRGHGHQVRCGQDQAGRPRLDPLAGDRIHQLQLRKEVPMKQVNLTITFDEEKLSALKRYMGKKELDLDREMTDALVKLYEKYVPAPVREYIDESDVNAAAPNKSRRSPKPVTPKPAEEVEASQ